MTEPVIAGRRPAKVELEAGESYLWCRCGRSQTQPFCDGAHRGTDLAPLKFTAEESAGAHLCLCKQSANAPYCDGTHARLPAASETAVSPPPAAGDGLPTAVPTAEESTV